MHRKSLVKFQIKQSDAFPIFTGKPEKELPSSELRF